MNKIKTNFPDMYVSYDVHDENHQIVIRPYIDIVKNPKLIHEYGKSGLELDKSLFNDIMTYLINLPNNHIGLVKLSDFIRCSKNENSRQAISAMNQNSQQTLLIELVFDYLTAQVFSVYADLIYENIHTNKFIRRWVLVHPISTNEDDVVYGQLTVHDGAVYSFSATSRFEDAKIFMSENEALKYKVFGFEPEMLTN